MKPKFNLSNLRFKIKVKYGGEVAFAKELGINPSTLSSKLNSKSYFTTDEIEQMCSLLDISTVEIGDYFFCKEC